MCQILVASGVSPQSTQTNSSIVALSRGYRMATMACSPLGSKAPIKGRGMDLKNGGRRYACCLPRATYRILQNIVTTAAVAAVCDRRIFGAHRAPLQGMTVTIFCSVVPHASRDVLLCRV